MINNIIFHPDIDGIISAALYLKYKLKKPINYRLHPVLSSYRNEKFTKIINDLNLSENDKLFIFDFERHKRADLWADHHFDKELKSQPLFTSNILYNTLARSTAQLIFNYLQNYIPVNDLPKINKIIKETNMIDSALYPNIDFIFTSTIPIMILRSYVDNIYPNDMTFNRIVETLVFTDFDISQTLSILDIDESCVNKQRENVMKAKQFMEVYNKISLIRQRRMAQFPRYAENFIRPDIKYNVRISPADNKKWQLQLAYNKFHKEKNEISIGKFIAGLDYMLSGGGRNDVGGGSFQEDILDQFLADLSAVTNNESGDIIKTKEEDSMEKLGVDVENDKFEKKAQDIVKEGSAKNIEEAREMINEEELVDGGKPSAISSNS
jgi:hypothetical protein